MCTTLVLLTSFAKYVYLLYLLLTPLLLGCTSSSWTTFRQNRQHHGFSSSTLSPKLKKFEYLTGNGVTSSPALSKDGLTMYVGSWDTYLHAIDLTTGKRKWRYKTDSNINSSPTIHPSGHTVYIGSYDHYVHAIDAATGDLKWKYETQNWVHSSPAVLSDGSVIFVGSLDGQMHCINNKDGSKNFTYDTGDEIWSSPVLSYDENTLYWGSYDNIVHATDLWNIHFKQEGVERLKRFYKWKYATEGGVYSSPSLSPDGSVLYNFGRLSSPYLPRPLSRCRRRQN